MQLTRALLLAGIHQALAAESTGQAPLDTAVQSTIWEAWKQNVLESDEDPAASWKKRRNAEGLGELGNLQNKVGSDAEGTLEAQNSECFKAAVGAA